MYVWDHKMKKSDGREKKTFIKLGNLPESIESDGIQALEALV